MNAQEAIRVLQEKLSEEDTVRLQCIFKTIFDSVVIADLERNIVIINSGFVDIFGYREHIKP